MSDNKKTTKTTTHSQSIPMVTENPRQPTAGAPRLPRSEADNFLTSAIAHVQDQPTKDALNVLNAVGEVAFAKHVFTEQANGNELSYADMRARHG